MTHSGNWRRFDFSNMTVKVDDQAVMEMTQQLCGHPREFHVTEITGRGDDVRIKTVCKICLKTISEE